MLRFNRILVVVAVSYGVLACSPTDRFDNSSEWIALKRQDPFTERKYCDITFGRKGSNSLLAGGYVIQNRGHIYPLIRVGQYSKIVGFTTVNMYSNGMNYNLPIGDVRMRIDRNSPKTISIQETPIEVSSSFTAMAENNAKAMGQSGIDPEYLKKSYEAIGKSMSPIVAAQGAKSEMMLQEMFAGSKMIYQQIAIQNTSVGSVPLQGLKSKYNECMDHIKS